jgi:GntR family transcriptional regulator, histidine utilization repressor
MATRTAPTDPAYLSVQRWLRDGITQGRWRVGDRLPSEAELVTQFGLSRMTINRALTELHTQGLVRRVRGSGSFVAPLERLAATLQVRDVHEQIAEKGHVHHAQVLALERQVPPAAVAIALGLRKGSAAFHSQLLHHDNGVPLQVESRWVHPSRAPRYLDQDFGRVTPTAYLLQVAPLVGAEVQIEAGLALPHEAQLLGVPETQPCLVMERLTHSPEGAVSWVRLVHPGSRYVLRGKVTT